MCIRDRILSIAAGIGAVLGRDAFDATVRGPRDIRDTLQVPALASIPVIVTAAERERTRRITRYSWQGGLAAVVSAAVVVHFFVRPLDVVWLILLRRFGV